MSLDTVSRISVIAAVIILVFGGLYLEFKKPKKKKEEFTADDAEFNRVIIESLKNNENKNENSHI
ncbi:hypothetical protein [Nitrosophilus alvini]|uniref:hypothetical protein n=1 Tax=Nitrosophilus alvini TaxID=2714855 RepID=UPI001909177C|nr:hypothetical protein [Nitrosophilus alvini]